MTGGRLPVAQEGLHVWTIEIAGPDRVYRLYIDDSGRGKYLRYLTAVRQINRIHLPPRHFKRLLLDGVVVRTYSTTNWGTSDDEIHH